VQDATNFSHGIFVESELAAGVARVKSTKSIGVRPGTPERAGHHYETSGDDTSWWRVRLRDRKTERVARLKDMRVDGWFAPAPNNSFITARNVGTNEIYALDWELP